MPSESLPSSLNRYIFVNENYDNLNNETGITKIITINDSDIDEVYQKCLNWLHKKGITIDKTTPPQYIKALDEKGSGRAILARTHLILNLSKDDKVKIEVKILPYYSIWYWERYSSEKFTYYRYIESLASEFSSMPLSRDVFLDIYPIDEISEEINRRRNYLRNGMFVLSLIVLVFYFLDWFLWIVFSILFGVGIMGDILRGNREISNLQKYIENTLLERYFN